MPAMPEAYTTGKSAAGRAGQEGRELVAVGWDGVGRAFTRQRERRGARGAGSRVQSAGELACSSQALCWPSPRVNDPDISSNKRQTQAASVALHGLARARQGHLTALLVRGAEVQEQLKGLVDHPVAARRGAVHLVDHHHHLQGCQAAEQVENYGLVGTRLRAASVAPTLPKRLRRAAAA